MRSFPRGFKDRQHGFVLVMAMIMLVVMTLLGISMVKSFGLQERIAGNTREKQRALEAAQSALQFAENWLGSGGTRGNGGGVECSGVINTNGTGAGTGVALITVCNKELDTPHKLPWAARFEYKPPGMSVDAAGGVSQTSGDINYRAQPGFYIYFVGLAQDRTTRIYRASAYGHAGSETAAAVVQSTYQLRSRVINYGGS